MVTLYQEYDNITVVAEWVANDRACLLEEVDKTLKARGIAASWEMRDGWKSPLLAEAAGKRDILILLNGAEPRNGEARLEEVHVKHGDIITVASLE